MSCQTSSKYSSWISLVSISPSLTFVPFTCSHSLLSTLVELSACVFRCDLSVTLCVNDLLHTWHLNGFSPVWIRRCVRRFENCEKAFPQCEHSNGRSPLCVRRWSRKWEDLPKHLAQYIHWNRFVFRVWPCWTTGIDFVLKDEELSLR